MLYFWFGRLDLYRNIERPGGLRLLLHIAAEIAQDRTGLQADWEIAANRLMRVDFPQQEVEIKPWHFNVEVARLCLQMNVRRLIHVCKIVPRFYWDDRALSWQIDLDSPGAIPNLPTLLAVQLIITMADKDGFAICSSCHSSYIPLRRPDPTRRNYCSKCGIQAAWRDAAREKRKREREEKHAQKTRSR